MNFMEVVHPRTIVFHFPAIPSEIMVVAFHICNPMHWSFDRCHGHMRDRRRDGLDPFLSQEHSVLCDFPLTVLEIPPIRISLEIPRNKLTDDCILNDQLFQLDDTVLM